ncbi:hypothetical protein [Pseudomonas phage COT4]|uniref:Uncharacterized protein n=1 Tax=Pseudomonas phage M5.1 TaxID=2873460 RepID=A0AAE8XFT6_9CAUD|nr:hypothetical protein QGX13_gp070 [Pseudomonas phage M5.1]UAV89753.1 hypothetical protein M51_172 [Pseudomonas phage M5.1]UGL61353.1 hypothetical protein [Pseudomonas phage COT4]
MAYKLRCNSCGRTFVSDYRSGKCTSYSCSSRDTDFIETVLDVAVGVAVGYATGSLIDSGVSAAVDVVGSIFDW